MMPLFLVLFHDLIIYRWWVKFEQVMSVIIFFFLEETDYWKKECHILIWASTGAWVWGDGKAGPEPWLCHLSSCEVLPECSDPDCTTYMLHFTLGKVLYLHVDSWLLPFFTPEDFSQDTMIQHIWRHVISKQAIYKMATVIIAGRQNSFIFILSLLKNAGEPMNIYTHFSLGQ